jgi:hypothetical protein
MYTLQQWHRRIRAAACGCTVLVLACIAVSVFPSSRKSAENASRPELADTPDGENQLNIDAWLTMVGKRPLFKPAVPLPARRVAGQTVERVRSMVRLNAILVRDNEPIAYIRIQNVGLRPFKVGDRVEELFAVTRIDAASVELEIAGERIRLDL